MVINFTYYRASASKISNLMAKLRFKRDLLQVTSRHGIQGFTLVKALGAWQGKTEPSYQLSLVDVSVQVVQQMAVDMKSLWNQDSVMVTDGNQVDFL